MSVILGLHYGHDGSACIVKDGKLIYAISSERITGIKKDYGVTYEVLDYVLDKSEVTYEDIDYIALVDYYDGYANDTLTLHTKDGEYVEQLSQAVFDNDVLNLVGTMRGITIPVYVLPHHIAHGSSVYYTSNLNSAVVFTLDSSGGHAKGNSMIAIGDGNKLNYHSCPKQMVGNGYTHFTQLLGLGPGHIKAGSTMGLASYGIPAKDLIENIDFYVSKTYDQDIIWTYYPNLFDKWNKPEDSSKKLFETKNGMNLAASIQYLFEKSIMDTIDKKVKPIGIKNLCLAGGSFLNCNINSIIKSDGFFDTISHFPACGDDGICVGSALYVSHHILDEPRHNYSTSDIMYMGTESKELEDKDYVSIAQDIADGKVIAWFSGGSEYGPRALGHRSLLADPRTYHSREMLNFVVKNREWFRPFAPVVLEEEAGNWFSPGDPSPYMLFTQKVLRPQEIPAVTHFDGTARIQTINEKTNKPYYKVVKEFFNITGVPLVINTSLNDNGKPMFEKESDAMDLFYKNTGIDVLVLNNKIFRK
jgi:carbamoyltransferase